MDWIVLHDWLLALVRWAHVIAAMGWIGASFYFIALDLGLNRGSHNPEGVAGDEWQVHGGGFYHVQKYQVAPASMPQHLVWFKWDSYATWLSGFGLLAIMYYLGADLYLLDPRIADLAAWQGALISMASLAFGWIIYDSLCRWQQDGNNNILMIGLFCVLVVMAWGYTQVFTGRAALLHLGAFTASIMTGNVFFIIMPNQRISTADLKAGRTPDPKFGIIAKQRSTHNNYLTLPVIFLMLSNHYPMVFATDYNWIIASLIFLIGVCIRIYFNTYHARKGVLLWPWVLAVALVVVVIILSLAPAWIKQQNHETAALSPLEQRMMAAPGFENAVDIVQARCSMCHTGEPLWDGIHQAPKGVILDNERDIARQARSIYLHAGLSDAMPPGNVSFIEPEERAALVAWVRGS